MVDVLTSANIEKLVSDGAGLAHVNGKTVFIDGTIPGETVLCCITENRRSWSRARITDIIEPSPARVTPRCAFYGVCGGCNLQHMDYSSQLAAKTGILKDAMRLIGGGPEPRVFSSAPWEYRNRMQFHVCDDFSGWGQKARKSNDIIPITHCPIADSGIQAILREGEREKIIPPPHKTRFTIYARGGRLFSEGGRTRGSVTLLNRECIMDAALFFQSNGSMLEKLITDLAAYASVLSNNRLPMADLYCGVGTFAAFLGKYFSHVDMVEENRAAAALARENTAGIFAAGISSACYAQNCAEWAKNNDVSKYALMVIDPPRTGLEPPVAHILARDGPPLLAYVSCDTAALARDAKILTKGYYRLTALNLYDFYPQTAHIETLALFER